MKKQIILLLSLLVVNICNSVQAYGGLAKDLIAKAGIQPDKLKIGETVVKKVKASYFDSYNVVFEKIAPGVLGILLPSIYQACKDKKDSRCGFYTFVNSHILGTNEKSEEVLKKLNDTWKTERAVNNLVEIFDQILENGTGRTRRSGNIGMYHHECLWLNGLAFKTYNLGGKSMSFMELLAQPKHELFNTITGIIRSEVLSQMASSKPEPKERYYVDSNSIIRRTLITFDDNGQLCSSDGFKESVKSFQKKLFPEVYMISVPTFDLFQPRHLLTLRAEYATIGQKEWMVGIMVDSDYNPNKGMAGESEKEKELYRKFMINFSAKLGAPLQQPPFKPRTSHNIFASRRRRAERNKKAKEARERAARKARLEKERKERAEKEHRERMRRKKETERKGMRRERKVRIGDEIPGRKPVKVSTSGVLAKVRTALQKSMDLAVRGRYVEIKRSLLPAKRMAIRKFNAELTRVKSGKKDLSELKKLMREILS